MNTKGIKILFLLVMLLAQPFVKASEVDSLLHIANTSKGVDRVEALDKISRYYWKLNPDSSHYYANYAMQVAKLDGGNLSMGVAYNSLGNYFNMVNSIDEAVENYVKAYNYCIEAEDNKKTAYILANLEVLYRFQHKKDDALRCAFSALEYSQKAKDRQFESIMLLRVSKIYESVRDFDKALEYALKAHTLLIELEDIQGTIRCFYTIGRIHTYLANYELAKDYLLQGLELIRENGTSFKNLRDIYSCLGDIHDELGDYEAALEYYEKSAEQSERENDIIGMQVAYNNIGFIYNRIKKYDLAIESLKKALAIAVGKTSLDEEMNIYNNLVSAYLNINDIANAQRYINIVEENLPNMKNILYVEETYRNLGEIALRKNDYKKAYQNALQEKAYHDTVYNIERSRSALEVQVRFETEAKEREIEILRKDNEISRLEVESRRMLQRVLFLILFVMLLLVIGTSVAIRLIRIKNKQLMQKNKEFENANDLLKKSERNLKQLNTTKDKLFSIIAHDLKNPFCALMGFSELLDNQFESLDYAQQKEYISIINESAQNLYKLLDNLLQWSRSQIGTITYTPEIFNINNLIGQEVDLLKTTAEKKDIKMSIDVNDNVQAYADINTISSVIRNLLSNAIKFSLPGGKIIVSVGNNDNLGMIEVVVSDTGVGISSSNIDELFDINASYTTKGTSNEQGTGLGLVLCKEFVENNGGKIWVISEKDNGSAFHFTLPASK